MNNKVIRIAQVMGKMNSGGVESVVMNYYKNIDKNKLQFDFIVDEDSTYIPFDEIKNMGGNVILVPPYQNIFLYINTLKKVFKYNEYKIVHSHLNTLSVFPLYAAKVAKVPVRIAHSHSTSNKKEWKKDLLKNTLKPFSKLYATHYFCCSELAGRWLFGDKLYDRNKVKLINNAIDIEKFVYNEEVRNKIRKKLTLDDKLVVTHIGRFVEQKNHIGLIDIFNEFHKINSQSILLLAGDGPLLENIKERVNNFNLADSVRFLGVRNDVNEIMQGTDIFLLPSLYEGLPVVGVEAQASGALCILSNNMTKEIKIIEATKFIDISDSPKSLAEFILDTYKNFKRIDTKQEIINANFEIKTEGKKLQNEYIELYRQVNYEEKIIFPINSKIYSGLESVAITIIENLKDKFDFIYVTQDGPIVDVLKEKKINYYIIKKMSIKEIRQCVKALNPDIIHAHDYTASCICSLAKINLPIISHLHNNSPWIKTLHPYSFLYLYASKRFNKILTVSDSIEKEYIFSNFIKDKIENISNPVCRDYILNKVNKNDTKKYDVCFVGRLTKQKNPLKFINIINDVKNVIPNIKAVMIGDGELKESCKKLIEDLELKNNIDLLGFKKNPYKYMNQSKIFCLTSEWEGYGLVAFEALTLGIPCVVSSVGGLVDIVDDECGYLVDSSNEFKESIIELIINESKYNKKVQKSIEKSIILDNGSKYYESIEHIYDSIGRIIL